MWGNKKPDAPQAGQPDARHFQTNQSPKSAPATWEAKPAMSRETMRPMAATTNRATPRLRVSLQGKGESSGTETLLIDGSVEGLITLDVRKLTLGPTAK